MRRGTSFYPNLAEVSEEVLQAMVRQPISHRSVEFHEIFASVQAGLQQLFCTARPVYVATASGTGMMEAAVRCAPQGRILSIVNGAFGERFVKIAHACERDVDRHDVEPGGVPDPEEVRDLLQRKAYSAVTLVHSETSTGALSDVETISHIARDAGAALIVDSVSGIGGAQLEVDAWGVDCVVSASQKALGLPPGLGFAVASAAFLRRARDVKDRGFYLDLLNFEQPALNNETPTTPSVALIFALERQLAGIRSEGVAARWARHEAMRAAMEDWVSNTRSGLGIEIDILAKAGARSPTVTVVTLPYGIAAEVLISNVAARGYAIGSGYGTLRGTTFRVGHMGDHTVTELTGCLGAITDALGELRPMH